MNAGSAALLGPTDWVELDVVARVFPAAHGVRLPFSSVTRYGGRQATVAAVAQALRMKPWQITQALVRAELKRLAAQGN